MTTTQLAMAGALDDISWNDGANNTGVKGSDKYSTPDDAPTVKTGGKKFQDTKVGGFFNMLLSNGGNIAQIISAIKGDDSTIKDGTGQAHDLTEVRAEIEKISAQKNQDMTAVMQMMMMQLQNEKKNTTPPKKNNNALYVGIGVGALVLLGGIFYITQNKKKKK